MRINKNEELKYNKKETIFQFLIRGIRHTRVGCPASHNFGSEEKCAQFAEKSQVRIFELLKIGRLIL